MNYAAAIEFLFNLEHGAVKLGLERIAAATAARGHPERRYATIHVAGTNGKGSTAALLAAILEAAGLRTGLLTSPHLLAYGERMRISGGMLPEEDIAALTSELRPLILAERLSYFEATTTLAFEAFARGAVQVAVIEVGMGGRLDATNVVTPALTVITGIDLDHTKSLGATRAAIAGEKAGIMKNGVPLLLAPCAAEVAQVFEARGAEIDAPVLLLNQLVTLLDWDACAQGSSYRFARPASPGTFTRRINLCGEHQIWNALLAEEAVRHLASPGLPIEPAAAARGLADGQWPGRFEVLAATGGRPVVILDVAHNSAGGASVAATYRQWMGSLGQPTLIVGMLGDKNHADFFGSLRAITDRLHLIPLESPRAAAPEALRSAAAAAGFDPLVFPSMAAAWQAACGAGTPVLITGSFFTVKAGMEQLGQGPARQLFPPHDAPALRGAGRQS